MTDTSTAMKYLVGFGALAAVIGPTFLVSQYVTDLQRDVATSKAEVERLKGQVEQLQDFLETTQANSSSALRGPKGDKGDPGERGPRGEQGEPGAGISQEELDRLVKQAVSSSLAGASASSKRPADASSPSFDESGCTRVEELRGAATFVVQRGMEVCDSEGVLIASIRKTFPGYFYVEPAVGSMITCSGGGFTCRFPWDRTNEYYIERKTEGDNGTVFKMRKKN